MARNRLIKHLIEENRGLKKRLNHVIKASLNNHTGMLYWKRKYEHLGSHYAAFMNAGTQLFNERYTENKQKERQELDEKRIPTNS